MYLIEFEIDKILLKCAKRMSLRLGGLEYKIHASQQEYRFAAADSNAKSNLIYKNIAPPRRTLIQNLI